MGRMDSGFFRLLLLWPLGKSLSRIHAKMGFPGILTAARKVQIVAGYRVSTVG